MLKWIEEQAARVLDTASASPPLGDPSWDGLLREYGVRPLSQEERQQHVTEGPKRRGGAAPIEVRLALQAIHDKAHASWKQMDIDDDERRLAQKLSSFVDENMRAYLGRVAPAITTASIFANARATTQVYATAGGGLGQMKCAACGAPRKNEGDLDCVYCGGKVS